MGNLRKGFSKRKEGGKVFQKEEKEERFPKKRKVSLKEKR